MIFGENEHCQLKATLNFACRLMCVKQFTVFFAQVFTSFLKNNIIIQKSQLS